MNPAAILAAILTYGPEILPVIHQVTTWIKNRKEDVTPEDIAQLIAYGNKTSDDYLKEVGIPPTTPS